MNLLRLGAITGDARYGERASLAIDGFGEALARSPEVVPQLLLALEARAELGGARPLLEQE